MGKRLVALSEYSNGPRGLHYRAGEEFEVSDADYLFLMADAPGCFEIASEPTGKALETPTKDKMLRQPKAKK